MFPGRRVPDVVTRWPRMASMLMRPCFTSTVRRRSKRSWSASFSRPRGSQKPRGGCAPISLSKLILRAYRALRHAGIPCGFLQRRVRRTWRPERTEALGANAVAEATRARTAMVRNMMQKERYDTRVGREI
eukprot:scaffold48_cov311-Pinguiococcus_pyrenoidosus.AAC.254